MKKEEEYAKKNWKREISLKKYRRKNNEKK